MTVSGVCILPLAATVSPYLFHCTAPELRIDAYRGAALGSAPILPRNDTDNTSPNNPLRPRLRLSWGDGSLRPASHHHAPTGRTLPSHPTTDNYRHSPTHPTHSIDLTGSPPEACGHSHRSHHNTSRTAAATLVHVGLTLWSLSVTDGLTPCSQSACAIVHGCATLCLLVPG